MYVLYFLRKLENKIVDVQDMYRTYAKRMEKQAGSPLASEYVECLGDRLRR